MPSPFEIRAAVIEGCRPEELIQNAQRVGQQTRCCIVCLDMDRVAGRRHVESAIQHALRAYQGGDCIADTLEMEVLLYAGGTRQTRIGRYFGVQEDTRKVFLCFMPPSENAVQGMELLVRYIEEEEDQSGEKLQRLMELFDISREEMDTVGRERIPDLVIERVALLEVYK